MLLIVAAKFGLKSAADIRMNSNILYRISRGKKDNPLVSVPKAAMDCHNARTKGNSGHYEGAPDPEGLVALLMEAHGMAPEEDQALIQSHLENNLPKSRALQASVLCCRVQAAHDQSEAKIYHRLRYGEQDVEDVAMKCVVESDMKELFGQAPKGSFERKVK